MESGKIEGLTGEKPRLLVRELELVNKRLQTKGRK